MLLPIAIIVFVFTIVIQKSRVTRYAEISRKRESGDFYFACKKLHDIIKRSVCEKNLDALFYEELKNVKKFRRSVSRKVYTKSLGLLWCAYYMKQDEIRRQKLAA